MTKEEWLLIEQAKKGDKIAQAKLSYKQANNGEEMPETSWNDVWTSIKESKAGQWLGNVVGDAWNGLTGKTSANATLEANKMNIENQNYWNEIAMQREDTAHQREVADLQAAGLNPWLSAGGGAPASALSTAQAEPVDGSKILQATSALALMAVVKLLGRTTSRTNTTTIFRR